MTELPNEKRVCRTAQATPGLVNMLLHTHLSFISELTSRVHKGGHGGYISLLSPFWQQKVVC